MLKKVCVILFITGFAAVLCGADQQQKIFDRTVKYLDRGGLYFHYQNTEGLSEQFAALLDVFGKTYVNDPIQQVVFKNVLQFLDNLKIDELQAFGSSSKRLNKKLFVNKLAVTIDPAANGMMCALPGRQNVSFRKFSSLPENTILALGAYWDWSNLYAGIEKNYASDENFKSVTMMVEMNTSMKLKDIMSNISGQYFIGLFKGDKQDEFHYLLIIPDRTGMLKKLASTHGGNMLKRQSNGSAIFEFPVATSAFGSGVSVLFAENQVMVYNSNAKVDELLNVRGRKKKLVNVVPQIFGNLKMPVCNSFMVMNFDTKYLDSKATQNIYRYSSLCTSTADGYLVRAMSNFNMQDLSAYTPLLEVMPDIQQILQKESGINKPQGSETAKNK